MQSSIFQKDIYKVDAVICKMCFMSREELNILVINSGFPNLEAIAQKIVILIMVKIILFNNQFHNILRLLDVLPNFLFTTSETMGHYYLET